MKRVIILDEQEYQKLLEHENDIAEDLRKVIFKITKFKCFHDLTADEKKTAWVDEGYCDSCPLSFPENEDIKNNFRLCNRNTLYSK